MQDLELSSQYDDEFLINLDEIPCKEIEEKFQMLPGAIWTHRKALLIRTYLQLFVKITRRGTYIDAFAGPQDGREDSGTWAARSVWEGNPGKGYKRIDRFELFEWDRRSAGALRKMIDATKSDGRKRVIREGDCNIKLPDRLRESPVKGPAFCLLDQRTDECNWDTVKFVSEHKNDPNKVEIFYFLMAGWYDRYLAALGDVGKTDRLKKWWGNADISILEKATPSRASELFVSRFKNELGYKHVMPFPIYDNYVPSEKGNVKFYMIHATDNDDAPGLMRRAYKLLALGYDPNIHQETMPFIDSLPFADLTQVEAWDRFITAEERKIRTRKKRRK
ncbi:MAG: three-Cys-motif partner protein TcmP [Armatimonadetes bacterium]|nr:three-Cys-motif partner protein TcmP [Akkermansiaceae bacterium]